MFGFNCADEADFEGNLVEGVYRVTITSAELKDAQSNPSNKVFNIMFTVTDDTSAFNGWKIYDNLNVINHNEVATKIGRGALKKTCEAIGIEGFQSPSDILGYELLVKVAIEEYQGRKRPKVMERAPVVRSAGYQQPQQQPNQQPQPQRMGDWQQPQQPQQPQTQQPRPGAPGVGQQRQPQPPQQPPYVAPTNDNNVPF